MTQSVWQERFPWDDLRAFIEVAKEIDEWREIRGADWNLEIGAVTEATAELIPEPPMLIFDEIRGYPRGYRVLSLPIASAKRAALAWGLPPDRPKLELIRLAVRKLQEAKARPMAPKEVSKGTVMENVLQGGKIDLLKFPATKFHGKDGGRYIGTGDVVITKDPETGYINMGTYRMQVHELDLLGLWISPGKHGRQICQRYWDKGESCPVVACFGEDPLTFLSSPAFLPWGKSELDLLGGLRGRPLEVLRGSADRATDTGSCGGGDQGRDTSTLRGGARRGAFWGVAGLLFWWDHWHRGAPTCRPCEGHLPSK